MHLMIIRKIMILKMIAKIKTPKWLSLRMLLHQLKMIQVTIARMSHRTINSADDEEPDSCMGDLDEDDSEDDSGDSSDDEEVVEGGNNLLLKGAQG
mmetsp:Transcript_23886/g.40731  ORF Transcript_23886/g.40731 Transcript_23886/m.40731 type:complete len:96 (-) Transcript_23886:17-304(-)